MRISDWSSDVCSSDLDRGNKRLARMAGGEGRSCSRNSFVVDGFPDGCGGSGGVQELAKAGRAEALGGSCGEYDALEMGQADDREGRPRHEDDRDGGLSGMTETVETTEKAAHPIPASIPMPDHHIRHTRSWQMFVRSEEHTSDLQSLMRISYAVFC